jgi:hypothetical protein
MNHGLEGCDGSKSYLGRVVNPADEVRWIGDTDQSAFAGNMLIRGWTHREVKLEQRGKEGCASSGSR